MSRSEPTISRVAGRCPLRVPLPDTEHVRAQVVAGRGDRRPGAGLVGGGTGIVRATARGYSRLINSRPCQLRMNGCRNRSLRSDWRRAASACLSRGGDLGAAY
jgi:hypothetical protein